jgi:hypothetical protein
MEKYRQTTKEKKANDLPYHCNIYGEGCCPRLSQMVDPRDSNLSDFRFSLRPGMK